MIPEAYEALQKWRHQVEKLQGVEEKYLNLEASEKSLLATLYLKATGSNVKERESQALASEEWNQFKKGLAQAKADFHHEKRKLDLIAKALDFVYLEIKINHDIDRSNVSRLDRIK